MLKPAAHVELIAEVQGVAGVHTIRAAFCPDGDCMHVGVCIFGMDRTIRISIGHAVALREALNMAIQVHASRVETVRRERIAAEARDRLTAQGQGR